MPDRTLTTSTSLLSHSCSNLPLHLVFHIYTFLPIAETACTARLLCRTAARRFSHVRYRTVPLSPQPRQAGGTEQQRSADHLTPPAVPPAHALAAIPAASLARMALPHRLHLMALVAGSGSCTPYPAASTDGRRAQGTSPGGGSGSSGSSGSSGGLSCVAAFTCAAGVGHTGASRPGTGGGRGGGSASGGGGGDGGDDDGDGGVVARLEAVRRWLPWTEQYQSLDPHTARSWLHDMRARAVRTRALAPLELQVAVPAEPSQPSSNSDPGRTAGGTVYDAYYRLLYGLPANPCDPGVGAARSGNVSALRWVLAHGWPTDPHALLCAAAMAGPSPAALDWCMTRPRLAPWADGAVFAAAAASPYGDAVVRMELLVARGAGPYTMSGPAAGRCGHEALDWLHARSCLQLTAGSLGCAGGVEVGQRLVALGCPVGREAVTWAAALGDVALLTWLHEEHGLRPGREALHAAAAGGTREHFAAMRWVLVQLEAQGQGEGEQGGGPWVDERTWELLLRGSGHATDDYRYACCLEGVQWLHKRTTQQQQQPHLRGGPGGAATDGSGPGPAKPAGLPFQLAVAVACARNDVPMLQWLSSLASSPVPLPLPSAGDSVGGSGWGPGQWAAAGRAAAPRAALCRSAAALRFLLEQQEHQHVAQGGRQQQHHQPQQGDERERQPGDPGVTLPAERATAAADDSLGPGRGPSVLLPVGGVEAPSSAAASSVPVAAAVFGPEALDAACYGGSLEVVELLLSLPQKAHVQGRRLTFCEAAGSGCTALVELLAAAGWPMGEEGLPYRVAGAQWDWDMLQCLKAVGCPWGRRTLARMVANERCVLAVLQWAVAAGAPVDVLECRALAKRLGRADVEQWLRKEGILRGFEGAGARAGRGGRAGGRLGRAWQRFVGQVRRLLRA